MSERAKKSTEFDRVGSFGLVVVAVIVVVFRQASGNVYIATNVPPLTVTVPYITRRTQAISIAMSQIIRSDVCHF